MRSSENLWVFDLSVFASLHRHRRLGSDPNAQDWRSRATRLVVVSLNFRMVAAFKLSSFFFPPAWPIRTRLGPYNCVSNEKQECTRTRVVQKLWQIITKPTTNKKQQNHRNQKRPANPPARFALRLKAKQRSNKERGRAQQTNTFRFALDTVTLATVSSSKTCKLIIHCGSA